MAANVSGTLFPTRSALKEVSVDLTSPNHRRRHSKFTLVFTFQKSG